MESEWYVMGVYIQNELPDEKADREPKLGCQQGFTAHRQRQPQSCTLSLLHPHHGLELLSHMSLPLCKLL